MNILAVDDERLALSELMDAIREVQPDATLQGFRTAREALAYAEETAIDVAFLDVHMKGMDGLALGEALGKLHPEINIIFVTGFAHYARDAFGIHASGFVVKPIEAENVAFELANLRKPLPDECSVRLRCFGSFGVFVRGEPLLFPRTKTKELLAYLVHKQGAAASTREIAAVLWEDRPYTNSVQVQTQQAIAGLMKLLESVDASNIILRERNSMAIDMTKVSCDYYDYLKDRVRNGENFNGQYMTEYSWGEATLAHLNQTR